MNFKIAELTNFHSTKDKFRERNEYVTQISYVAFTRYNLDNGRATIYHIFTGLIVTDKENLAHKVER